MTTQQPIRMLSIDDRMLTTELERAGYRSMGVYVRNARDFAQATEIINQEPIDIIVINYDYDRVDAPIVCKHFKTEGLTSQIPVVITSVQTNAETKKKSLGAGADLFVEQPLPRQYFIEKLKQLLEQTTRGQDRVTFQGHAEISFSNHKLQLPIGDLSATGILLATDKMFTEAGTELEISFELPGYKKPITATGEVVRHVKQDRNNPERVSGVGVKFKGYSGDSQKRLERYIEKSADKQAKLVYYL